MMMPNKASSMPAANVNALFSNTKPINAMNEMKNPPKSTVIPIQTCVPISPFVSMV